MIGKCEGGRIFVGFDNFSIILSNLFNLSSISSFILSSRKFSFRKELCLNMHLLPYLYIPFLLNLQSVILWLKLQLLVHWFWRKYLQIVFLLFLLFTLSFVAFFHSSNISFSLCIKISTSSSAFSVDIFRKMSYFVSFACLNLHVFSNLQLTLLHWFSFFLHEQLVSFHGFCFPPDCW